MQISRGSPDPLGLSFQGDRANFSLYSSEATAVFLGIFTSKETRLKEEIPLEKTGNIWHIALSPLPKDSQYAFRCEGPHLEEKGQLYQGDEWLGDPYAKLVKSARFPDAEPIRPFDWQNVSSPCIPMGDLIIYEMHVRGFTKDLSSRVAAPGTYIGMIEKIPYLKKLGINAVELLPLFEFETRTEYVNPKTKEPLLNYWGYQPLYFLAPVHRFALKNPIEEFKTLVKELHRNGIEVILDVVYNHTGEGKEKDRYVNFRGIDNRTYYQIDEKGNYRDFAGCGNTFNANHPMAEQLILDSLRYWAEEMHVDGFRFDLAFCLTRGPDGTPLPNPPLFQSIQKDPILKGKKLIAEPWDAAGLYQLGHFPKTYGPTQWSEWNGFYRDAVRRFIKGTDGQAGLFANALTGSATLYDSPANSVNFITAHDGFCLNDLVTYQQKLNEENGEMNLDGSTQNDNWNCGVEGPTHIEEIQALRERQIRNLLLALFISQGVPMMLMGDEYLHTRFGNNNPYVQDNKINWFLWDELEKKKEVFNFVADLIAFRKKTAQFHHSKPLTDRDIEWHGALPHKPDWSMESRLVAFTLLGQSPLYFAFNAHPYPVKITLPPSSKWKEQILTSKGWGQFSEEQLPEQIELPPYSALAAIKN